MKRSTVFAFCSSALLFTFALLIWPSSTDAEPGKPKKTPAKDADVTAQLDALLEEGWKAQSLDPSEGADDSEFLRRVTLDITGQIPTSQEVRAFLMTNDPDKRRKKIDELLESPLYAEHWSFLWLNRLLDGSKFIQARNPEFTATFRKWFRETIASNKPYNEFVYEILTATGQQNENGATAWAVAMDGAPEDMAASASRNFMGVLISCAQCHDSKTNEWKMGDFWGVAAFFSRTQVRRVQDPETKMVKAFEVVDLPRGEVALPEVTPVSIVEPKFLEGKVLARPAGKMPQGRQAQPKNPNRKFIAGPADGVERRKAFADWLVSDDNKYFAKAAVNRMWGYFMGAGFVEPVDDLDPSNPATNAKAFDLLIKDFKAGGYDVKRLIRVICNTRAYQLSSKPSATNAKDDRYYSHAKMQHLSPDQIFYSLMTVTGLENSMARGMDRDRLELQKQRFLAGFVFLFGNDEGESGDSFNGTIPQALLLMNNPNIQNGLKSMPTSRLGRILAEYKTPEDRLDEMYLTTLSRFPSPTEKKYFVSVINKHEGSKVIYEDLYWALVNSSEFQFNH